MKIFELKRLKRTMGAITFGLFFSNENKRLEQKQGIGKQLDLVLVTPGTQTNTVSSLRTFTGWTVKKSTAFYKEGGFPKVVIYNVDPSLVIENKSILYLIEDAESNGVIFKIY
jgi:hypothetical protein